MSVHVAYFAVSVQEAKQILNIQDIHDKEKLMQNYEHLFNQNDKSKGGSLYLQSKVSSVLSVTRPRKL